ncbi:MAG: extracellular solute-binding protein [Butyrivibrio sp.]|nr:extracellular solute-binding protein [Butyrivibrio sp.]
MKIKKIVGKVTSAMLVFTICTTALAGCGKRKITDEDIASAKQIDKNCIFKQEGFTGILDEGDSVEGLGRSGDKIAAICKTGSGGFKYITFKPDGSDVQTADIGGKEEDFIEAPTFDDEGNAYLIYREFKGEDVISDAFLEKIDPTGNVVYKFDISKEFSDDPFFIRCLEWSNKYGLLCGTSAGIQTYDEQNGLKVLVDKKLISGMDGIKSIVELPDNKMFVYYFDSNYHQLFVTVDADNKKAEKKLGDAKEGYYDLFFGDKDGNIYTEDSYGIYKYDKEADKLTKILDYRDSSIVYDEIEWIYRLGCVALSEKEIIVPYSKDEGGNTSLVKLTKVNPEDVGNKTVITMSGIAIDSDIVSQIMEFNRTSDKYAIKILDYSEYYDYSDYKEMIKQFNLDLTSGRAADIICFSGMDSSVRKYVDKGILLDLTPAFEKGGPLGDIELLPNIAEVMKYDGKTYTFIPSFEVSTYVVKSENANGKNSLTYDDYDKLIKSAGTDYKDAFGSIMDRTDQCSYLWAFYGDEFFDLKNKKCNFDSPEFISFLNFVNKFPEVEEEVDYVNEGDIEQVYIEGRGIFYSAEFRNIWEYAKLKQVVFNGDVEFVGCPNNSGKNLAVIDATTLGINSKTEHKDVIYDLIKELMNPDPKSDGFSSVKPKFEEELQEATREPSDNNRDAQVYDPVSGDFVKLKPLSQEDIKKFYDYTVSINSSVEFDSEVSGIITEEASAFFAGQKSAEEVAKIIQKRVSIYINETS